MAGGEDDRGLVSHAILGVTTERVIRRTTCPMLAVRDVGL
jgi:nucleotide-binding universal stress UspA family protein